MEREEQRRLADQSLADSLSHFAEHARGGAAVRIAGVWLFAGGHPYPGAYCNAVLRLDPATDAARTLREADAFFAPRRRGYAVWVRDEFDPDLEEAARGAGLFLRPPEGGLPGMVSTRPPEPPVLPEGSIVRRVDDLAAGRDYLTVLTEAYGLDGAPLELSAGIFFDAACLLPANVAAFLVYLDDRPVAGAMAIVSGKIAGILWGATTPAARRRGLGEACVRLATRAGFDMGAELAVLQASAMGAPIWKRLGFVEVTRYRRYLAPPPRTSPSPPMPARST